MMKRSRLQRLAMSVAMAVSGGTVFGSCNGELAREFRTVAAQGLHDGVSTIADSVIDGIFAVITPDENSAS